MVQDAVYVVIDNNVSEKPADSNPQCGPEIVNYTAIILHVFMCGA
jgi:hypothetical protein